MASLTLSLSRIKTYQQYHRHPTIILSPPFPAMVLPSPPNSHLNPPPHPPHALLLTVSLSPRAAVETLVLFSGHGCEVEDLQIEWSVVVVKNLYLQITVLPSPPNSYLNPPPPPSSLSSVRF
ncbi:hypothetical protein HanRHA438_Chr09g0408821 [Helianthus annuus]|uniref:Uncharacterized protein n=1 Tax=Helianthus annuus TaxID=4232 RepID=A0A9K3I7F1_HELAN|nr:hypothetical protein HanXRQr2_Chr09g0397071 [Helianthus annuus]KAJ0526674.1 hypothetical protein HanHA300_Chr09g0325811 [Helianthus annuus]KAJ0535183.1 hypothetical protein HanIR_Chr09g0427941 [Helianthus annuus]KAJ0543069.1 hypothetical protein HanHA89_Chr09g0346741 [Helianthus annuus]KAJ0708122.1 hypothetical protein HanLR1_Chr09g0326051 [Helianthus annuus]